MNTQILMVVGGIALIALIYNIVANKKAFPCNCPECQENAIADAMTEEEQALPQLGEEQAGAPAFVTVLYSIVILFVIAGLLAIATRIYSQGAKNIKKRVEKLPYIRRFR